MTPMDAWAAGKPLLIWPDAADDPRFHFLVAGHSRLPKGDVFFTDTWNDPTFGKQSVHLLHGHAKHVRLDVWRVASAEIGIMDVGPYRGQAARVRDFNRTHGAD